MDTRQFPFFNIINKSLVNILVQKALVTFLIVFLEGVKKTNGLVGSMEETMFKASVFRSV